jgi:tetratricopeptide (TPR) repeat protein
VARKLARACILGVFLSTYGVAQTNTAPPASSHDGKPAANTAQQPPDETEPPEEDETVKPRTYTFDPMEAERSIKVGNFYMRQGSRGYRAAAGRYSEATKYDPKNAEAFFRLGEAEEKLKNKEKAGAAFRRVVELSPESKLGKEAQKKLAGHS